MTARICRFFAASKCKYGAQCKFVHDAASVRSTDGNKETATGAIVLDELEELLKRWRFKVPKDDRRSIQRAQPLGDGLANFLQDALQLVNAGGTMMQTVIRTLATDGGHKRLLELLEEEYDAKSDATLLKFWTTELLPLLRILSHDNVTSSLVLETHHVTLLNCLYGGNGRHAVRFVRTAVRCLASETASNADDMDSCLAVFAGLLVRNEAAKVNQDLKTTAEALLALVEHKTARRATERHIRSIRLSLDLEIADAQTTQPNRSLTAPHATFTIAQDLPGEESTDGPRHDNDFSDIKDIQILPTMGEIQSSRLEYLPREDPCQWHLPGMAGLIDRHFRLVREDTVGQLRDAAKFELERMQNIAQSNPPPRQQGARTHVYHNVHLQEVSFSEQKGMLFVLSFDQPRHNRDNSTKHRAAWWEESKRLASDSLICLLSSDCNATFLVVHAPPTSQQQRPAQEETGPPIHERYTLAEDPSRGFVVAELASTNTHLARDFLKQSASGYNIQRSLIEFPGVVLPAFEPTLLALQQMSQDLDVPFGEALIPGNVIGTLQPPAYALTTNFRWDLTPLATEEQLVTADASVEANLKASSLDDAQQRAVQYTLENRIALIQGPPGTGKSYTGVKLIQSLLNNKASGKLGPIICVCFTNHALDQLLESLVDAQVEQVIRIGSRSKSERLAAINLRRVSQGVELTKMEKEERWKARTAIEQTRKAMSSPLHTMNQLVSGSESVIARFLEQRHPGVHAQLFSTIDEEGFETKRPKSYRPLSTWLQGGESQPDCRPLVALQAPGIKIMMLAQEERQLLFQSWVNKAADELCNEVELQLDSYNESKEKMDRLRGEADLRILSTASVIGITTTGLARNLKHLRKLTSKVLVVEEAGEVLEAHLLTAMLPSLEHIILIGDHQQLRPKVQNYEMSVENPRSQVALDVSLFERLVQPRVGDGSTGLPFVTLATQRRMHPAVSNLIRSTLYPHLQDAPAVAEHPEVSGMRRRLFWFDHDKPEDGENEQMHSTSHTNEFEVDMVASLVRHLVRQGVYAASDIAVLTPYLGQLRKLRLQLGSFFDIILNDRDVDDLARDVQEEQADEARRPSMVAKGTLLQALRVATVDNFQGEEAKVVIISLVRSNKQHKCGFLRTSNRINVLLSRAKDGMYIIGNSQTSAHIDMWSDVLGLLMAGDNFGTCLELCCPRHPEVPLQVFEPADFARVAPEAGCDLLCGKQLPCGHACASKCHADSLHNAVYCLKECTRPKKGCEHPCKRPCGAKCDPKCTEIVNNIDVMLTCGHRVTTLPCWQYQDQTQVQCKVLIERIVPGCEHKVTVHCHEDVTGSGFHCREICATNLHCGHECKKKCSTCRPRAQGTISKVDHGACNRACNRDFTNCQHSCTAPCHPDQECPPCSKPCTISCAHSACSKKCSEPCTPCAEETCSSSCPHSACSMPCAAPCNWTPCHRRCEKKLNCGHQCPSLCGEICPGEQFCQICANDEVKDKRVDLVMLSDYRDIDLDETPCLFLACGHISTVETLDGMIDISRHYRLDDQGRPLSIRNSSEPLSQEDQKFPGCPECRGSLRSIARYGRVVRRAMLDENTKKFITSASSSYRPLAAFLQKQEENFAASQPNATLPPIIELHSRLHIQNVLQKVQRYKDILKLRSKIVKHLKIVSQEEQPFQRVRDLVESARRRQDSLADMPEFKFDETILQTRGELLAQALLLRCDLVIARDIMSIYEQIPAQRRSAIKLVVDFASARQQCENLLATAKKTMNLLQQAEADIFWAQFAALEYTAIYMQAGSDYREQSPDKLKQDAFHHLDRAQELCTRNPGQTATVVGEIDAVRKMFTDSISASEMKMVVQAMSAEFSVTGHWYRCVNNHPFTVGECGGPMQMATCPQCGAAIGGQSHIAAAGVTRAEDIEQNFGNMRI